MTGDMVNAKDNDFEVFINLAEQISKSFDVYYIVGNHEQDLNEDKRKILMDKLSEIESEYWTMKRLQFQEVPKALIYMDYGLISGIIRI